MVLEVTWLNKSSTLGLIVMLIGAVMLLTTSFTYAILGVDTTKPNIVSSTPFDKTGNNCVPVSFISTAKYSVHVTDSGCGVSSVTYLDSVTQGYVPPTRTLTKVSGTANDGVWEASFPAGALYAPNTDYTFTFIAVDGQGNGQTLSGTFRIYTALAGKWYIGTTEVTSPTQTVWVNTNSVTFKFVKTAGVPDSMITCTLSGGASGTLSLVSANTWSITKTLADGTYTITMTANDGTNSIVMSIYDFGIGEDTVLPDYGEGLGYLFSFGLLCLGFVMYAKGRKKQ